MKLILLHGAGIVSSRKKLIDFKNKFDRNTIVVFGEGSDFEDIKNNLAATPLFSSDRLVVLENPPEDFTDYTLYPIPYTLIFWFDHEVSSTKQIMAWVKKSNGQILYFPESKEISVFPFLDSLAIGDKKAFFQLSNLKGAGFEIQYFITMIFYLLRNLIATPSNVPEFVKKKLAKQRIKFNPGDLKNLYKRVLEIDYKIKQGLLEKEQAEFLLVNKFLD